MKIALCTTTIHVPHALKLLRKCSGDVQFFVAGDTKTPTLEVLSLLNETTSSYRYNPDYTYSPGDGFSKWKCSEAIGFNTIARRNIAFLEALKWGADLIYSWDDDNIPVSTDHFGKLEDIFVESFNGLLGSSKTGWLDPGDLIYPATRHRGFPYNIESVLHFDSATNFRVGVAAGLVLGNPDVDAITRMENSPDIQVLSEVARVGVVVDPHTFTVFNSQNTAVIRELIPAWFMMPHVGRHDDIYASLIVQRVARERGLHVHFGPPFTHQQRNPHNLIHDLRDEIDGMENVTRLAELLDAIILPGKFVLEDTRIVYRALEHCTFLPDEAIYAAHAWLDDVESIL
jgi:hypothetical protein